MRSYRSHPRVSWRTGPSPSLAPPVVYALPHLVLTLASSVAHPRPTPPRPASSLTLVATLVRCRAAWRARSQLVYQWAPTLVGLSLIPLMPLFDEPMEHLLERLFHSIWPLPQKLSSPSTLTDYQAAHLAEEELRRTQPPAPRSLEEPAPPPDPPISREEPELVRATGSGDPGLP